MTKKAKIMIVEDEFIILEEMKSILENLGYDVTATTASAEKAIDLLNHKEPDLVLMDIRLKGKMDGIEAAQIIRSQYEIPVVFSTAYLDQERIERAKITMPFGYVLKPIQERDLKVTLEMALYVAKVKAERKKAEEELKFRSQLLDAVEQAVIVTNMEGQVIFWNPFAEKLYGYSSKEAIGKTTIELIATDDSAKHGAEIMDSLQAGNSWSGEYLARDKNGKEFSIHSTTNPVFDDKGNLSIIVGVSYDISEKKEF